MKEKIIDALDANLEAYGGGDGDHVGITEKSLQIVAEEITQLMCDASVRQMWHFGRWPEGFFLLNNAELIYLRELGFSDDQINKSLADLNNLK